MIIKKSELRGSLSVPPSKSQTLRAQLFAKLGKGAAIHNPLISPDTEAMTKALDAKTFINAGNSGIVLRFCTAIAALGKEPITITGDHSIQTNRPMDDLINGLSQLGAKVKSQNGFAPLEIQGPIKPGKVVMRGEDSQPVSALLIAASQLEGTTEIEVTNPGEKPWVALTLKWLGNSVQNYNFSRYIVKGKKKIPPFTYTVPGDFSSALYPLVAAIITDSELTINGLDFDDLQGDKEVIFLLKKMGANLQIEKDSVKIKKGGKLKGLIIDINPFIDAITILAVAGCFAEGTTTLVNGAIAKSKECNRISCIAKELKKMGANIEETEEGLIIRKSPLTGAKVNSYNDHRMALSLAVAAMAAEGKTIVENSKCLSKTYPTFVKDFQKIGGNLQECDFVRTS